ncbi:MAG TPA: aminodeoxychorismate/anthranilate synthase component II [Planctomycetaceae bacterium]|nr:aminodeoxychorismate/anthranilate synthase component II [Planctomycetaceae bacterium]
MILLIDNYDSFVHNLARYVRELGHETVVVRNDAVSVADVLAQSPQAIIISPGPCTPAEAGVSVPLIQSLAGRIPLLGVCLGHQAIGAAYGANVIRAPEPVHGRVSWVRHEQTPLFRQVSNPFRATRYHSLIVDEATLPPALQVTARTDDGLPMALEDAASCVYGLQFHPESVLTEFGHQLLANFLNLADLPSRFPPATDRLPTVEAPPSTVPPVTPARW